MAKPQLKPKCKDMLYQLAQRAEQQLREAYDIYKQLGKLHWYTATDSTGKQVQWHDCVGSHSVTIRQNEYGRLVFHYKHEECHELEWCNTRNLCECADHLLQEAYNMRQHGF